MKLTWLGHACFLLEQAGYTVLLDPYTGVEGYPPLRAAAHQVFCSHQHFDHCAVELAEPLPARECPFAVREVPTFHDGQGGALRGENTIRVFSAGGFTAAHLGDLGHQLSQAQLEAVGQVETEPSWTDRVSAKALRESLSLLDKTVRMVRLSVMIKRAAATEKSLDILGLSLFLPDELLGAYYLALIS